MSVYISWSIDASYKDGRKFPENSAIEISHALDCCVGVGADYYLFPNFHTDFETTSINAMADMRDFVRDRTAIDSGLVMEVRFQSEYSECPDKWVAENGKIVYYEGHVVFEKVKVDEEG